MNKRIKEAEALMIEHGDDPVPWYVRGWLGRFKQGFYYDDLQKAGKHYNRYASENQALIKEYQSYYRKALDLDDNPDAPAHLDHYMLTAMGTDVLAAPDIKERSFKKKLALNQQGNVLHENQEWGTYEFLLGTYAAKKDYASYLKTVNEMIERFPNSPRMNELLEYKRQAEAAIEKRDRGAALQEDDSGDEQASAPVAKPAQPLAKMKQAKTKQPDNGHERIRLFALLAVLLIGVGGFFIRRRNKAGKSNDD